MIYLDNNATTQMPEIVIAEMMKWVNRGNPSSAHKSAQNATAMMNGFKKYLLESICRNNADKYECVLTSGASESNSAIIMGAALSLRANGHTFHVIASAIEHKSILLCLDKLSKMGFLRYTLIAPDKYGRINVEDIEKQIRADTRLICVMHANNETGVINDIEAISKLAISREIPYHCDMVQSFSKGIVGGTNNITSMSISFHKLYAAPGCGAWIILKEFYVNFEMNPIIYGTQNDGMRGGTENLPGIASASLAVRLTLSNREQKNNILVELKDMFHRLIAEHYTILSYEKYLKYKDDPTTLFGRGREYILVSLSTRTKDFPADVKYLPTTIMISIVRNPASKKKVCNIKVREYLSRNNIIVSIGSACNTSSASASHVLESMGADIYIKSGALRISTGDYNTQLDIKKLVACLGEVKSGQYEI